MKNIFGDEMAKWDHDDLRSKDTVPRFSEMQFDAEKAAAKKMTPDQFGGFEPAATAALIPYKYHEDTILKEIGAYIDTTYKGHYVGEDNVQSLDLILATGHATGFNIGNILKYGSRYGKKRGYNRDDLLKVIHYAIFELYNQSKVHNSD